MAANVGPYSPDLLTHIINVQWGGTVFVCGDDSGQIWRSSLGTAGFAKVYAMGTPHEGVQPGQCLGSSYGQTGGNNTPSFVIGGHIFAFDHFDDSGVERGLYTIGKIMHSADGLNWTEAFSLKASLTTPSTVVQMIWDEETRQFYAQVNHIDEDGELIQQCYASVDGASWAAAGDASVFNSHCKYKDAGGNGRPDGGFGLDPDLKGSTEIFPFGHVMEDGLLITTDDMAGSPITFADGMWGRANYGGTNGKLEASEDDGRTWQEVGNATPYDPELGWNGITAICAGRPS